MKLTFLGTGTSQGVPVIACRCHVCRSVDERDRRLRTSALLTTDDGKHILFDIGPDFRQQMLRQKVESLDAIMVTHAHRDHDYGYIFEHHEYPGLPEADLHEVDAPFVAAGVTVIPVKAMHKDLPILAFRVGEMAYITDANHIAPEELEKLKGVKVMVINALRRQKHFSHFSLPEALEVIDKVQPEQAYLTHISHEMGLHAEVEKTLPQGVFLAYDNLEVEI